MRPKPQFIQGVYPFEGQGLDVPTSLADTRYKVPSDKRAQLVYLRVGNSAAELANVVLMRDGKAMRLFPVGAKASLHVPLTVVEDLRPDSQLELFVAAPAGAAGQLVLDIGLLEVD